MQLANVLVETNAILEQYRQLVLDAHHRPLSVDFYLDVIEQYTGYSIEVKTPKAQSSIWASDTIRGFLKRWDQDRVAQIYVARRQEHADDPHGVTFCEQRFIVIKEACHLLIDTQNTYTDKAKKLIENILFNAPRKLSETPEEFQSEFFALIAAMELLFPADYRDDFARRIERGDLTHLDIANTFKVPERYVFLILSENMHPIIMDTHKALAGHT